MMVIRLTVQTGLVMNSKKYHYLEPLELPDRRSRFTGAARRAVVMFDVTIKTLDGRNSIFTVDDEIKVEDFKVEVEAKLEIPVAQQRLIFQGRALQDDSRLIDCAAWLIETCFSLLGVQNKVVHLVPRPPPSAQREPRPEPVSVTNSAGTNSTFSNVPWGGIDMQQAIQDITTGIFNGLGDFTRNVHVPLHNSNEQSGSSHTRSSALHARENAFSRLHQEATHLLRRIARHPASPQLVNSTDSGSGTSDSTAPTAVAADCHDATNGSNFPNSLSNGSEPPPLDISAISSQQTAALENSPMAVDPESDSVTVPPVHPSTDDRSSASDSAIDLPISTLAGMLSRHRRLWRSAEPYLERWENMLNNESHTQQESLNCPTMPPASESVEDLPEHLRSRDDDSTAQLSERTGSPLPLTDGSRTSEPPNEWRHRFFTQISRLLHLHAHMLHLISDFNVISMSESAVTSDTQTGVATTSPVDGITAHNVTSEQCSTLTEESVDAAETNRSQCKQPQRNPHPRRMLHVPDSGGQLIRVRDSIEFIDSTRHRVPASGAQSRLSNQTGVPSSTQDRRRSQSASNVNRDQRAATGVSAVPPTMTSNGVQHSRMPAAPASVRSMPLTTGGTAIIRRVDIPIISVNMINIPVTHGAPTTTVLSESGHTVTSAPPVISVPPVVSSAPIAEAQTVVEVGVSNPVLPSIATQPIAFTSGLIDPFLLCNSRHFSHEHHIRTPAHLGSFSVPFPAVQVLQSDASVRSGAPQSRGFTNAESEGRSRTTSEQVETTTSSTLANDRTTTTTTATESTSPSYPGLLQHIASFVSAATNAATSAAVAGGLDMGPFNMFVSSSPIHFAMNAHHPNASNSSTTTAGTATPTTTVVGGGGSVTSRSSEGLGSLFGRHNPLLSTTSVPPTVQSSQGTPHSGNRVLQFFSAAFFSCYKST
ncbi:uncharacterized protein DEA37_0006719 [Paragonimus westermani]|uniref:Ubiquitin-like domain-containing protein n=1 Tax=Paragonimus westermani TaxID=34504 RepID=A0A5J4NCR7_9TREM|nr:uncharacterized protein DEA37_0006719 [Paragonimus westermani]